MSSPPIPFKEIKALSFDIYGTLIDWETGIAQAYHASPLSPHLPTSLSTLLHASESHERAAQAEHPTWPYPAILRETFLRYARSLALPPSSISTAALDEAATHFAASIGAWPAFPDTVAAIKQLRAHFKLIPLSNVDRDSFARTLAGPLAGCAFDAVYTAQDIGSYKPDPANFRYLLEHARADFGVERAALVHVAQSLFHDHAPAREAGIVSVWVDRRGGVMGRVEGEPERFGWRLRVESLGELARVVEEALSGGEGGAEVG
ncbi:hypothetical protein LTR50_000066 [Elasticomyces elasticus]|nr:hypothetical protein LTR50_000066 [Elasticomyces elasticus]